MTTSLNAKVQLVPPSPDAIPSGNGTQNSVPAETSVGGGDQFSVSGRNHWKSLTSGSETPSELGPLMDEWARTPVAPGDDINNVLGPLVDELHATEPAAEDAVSLEEAVLEVAATPLSYEDHMQSLLRGKNLGAPGRSGVSSRVLSLPPIPKVAKLLESNALFESPDAIEGILDRLGALEKSYRILYKQTLASIHSGGLSSAEFSAQSEYAEALKGGLINVHREIESGQKFLAWSLDIQRANRLAEIEEDS